MTRQTRRAGAFLVALGSAVAVLALLAGPASAQQTSGGATATDGSVASGDAHASRNSTASGDATAINNSTASGCSTAINNSTASGDDTCGPTTTRPTTATTRPPAGGGTTGGTTGGGGGAGTTTAGPATATTAARLAFTGSWSAPIAAMAALAIALGAWLLVAASDRRRASFTA